MTSLIRRSTYDEYKTDEMKSMERKLKEYEEKLQALHEENRALCQQNEEYEKKQFYIAQRMAWDKEQEKKRADLEKKLKDQEERHLKEKELIEKNHRESIEKLEEEKRGLEMVINKQQSALEKKKKKIKTYAYKVKLLITLKSSEDHMFAYLQSMYTEIEKQVKIVRREGTDRYRQALNNHLTMIVEKVEEEINKLKDEHHELAKENNTLKLENDSLKRKVGNHHIPPYVLKLIQEENRNLKNEVKIQFSNINDLTQQNNEATKENQLLLKDNTNLKASNLKLKADLEALDDEQKLTRLVISISERNKNLEDQIQEKDITIASIKSVEEVLLKLLEEEKNENLSLRKDIVEYKCLNNILKKSLNIDHMDKNQILQIMLDKHKTDKLELDKKLKTIEKEHRKSIKDYKTKMGIISVVSTFPPDENIVNDTEHDHKPKIKEIFH